MSVDSVMIALQASGGADGVTEEAFLAPLKIDAGDVLFCRADGRPWTSGLICFAVIRYSDYSVVDTSSDGGAQSVAFEAKVAESFRFVATFLDQRSIEVTKRMRQSGLSLSIFVEVRMDQDQMELMFPAEFVAACSRHELGLHIISNDF